MCRADLPWRRMPASDAQKERLRTQGITSEMLREMLSSGSFPGQEPSSARPRDPPPPGVTSTSSSSFPSSSSELGPEFDPWTRLDKGFASDAISLLNVETKLGSRAPLELDSAWKTAPASQPQVKFLTDLARQAKRLGEGMLQGVQREEGRAQGAEGREATGTEGREVEGAEGREMQGAEMQGAEGHAQGDHGLSAKGEASAGSVGGAEDAGKEGPQGSGGNVSGQGEGEGGGRGGGIKGAGSARPPMSAAELEERRAKAQELLDQANRVSAQG